MPKLSHKRVARRPRIALVVTPFNDTNLQLASQIGVDDIVYYDMNDMPRTVDELRAIKDRVERFGMKLSVIEGGPPMAKIKRGEDGREEEIEVFKQCLINMGTLGISTLCYNFMPPELTVCRTSYDFPIRGGALSSAFRMADVNSAPLHSDPSAVVSAAQLWENLEYFFKAVVPVAEEAGVNLALHPDDPPVPMLRGIPRIIDSITDLAKAIDLVPSPRNGITFCQGTISEMADVGTMGDAAVRFKRAVHFVHFRDVVGKVPEFLEVFQDQGQTDMLGMLRVWKEMDFSGPIRPDHVPLLAGEEGHAGGEKAMGYTSGKASGYTMAGRLFAVGYMQGLFEAVWGKKEIYINRDTNLPNEQNEGVNKEKHRKTKK